MMLKIASTLGYAKAPTPSYLLKHPVKGAQRLVAHYAKAKRRQRRVGFVLGAAMALPLAYLAVRRARG